MKAGRTLVLLAITIAAMLLIASCGGGGTPPTILTTTLPDGQVNQVYSFSLSATGGRPPYTWTILSGNFPSYFMSLSSEGLISGVPALSHPYSFTVQVADASSRKATQQLTLTINPAPPPPLAFTTLTVPQGTLNVGYRYMLAVTGGTSPYTYSVTQGTLPIGLMLSSDGVISGTPTQVGEFPFTVQVADSENPAMTADAQFTLTVVATPLTSPHSSDRDH
jgi:hypothetical protein